MKHKHRLTLCASLAFLLLSCVGGCSQSPSITEPTPIPQTSYDPQHDPLPSDLNPTGTIPSPAPETTLMSETTSNSPVTPSPAENIPEPEVNPTFPAQNAELSPTPTLTLAPPTPVSTTIVTPEPEPTPSPTPSPEGSITPEPSPSVTTAPVPTTPTPMVESTPDPTPLVEAIDTSALEEYGRNYAETTYGYDGNSNTGFDSGAGYFPPSALQINTMEEGFQYVREVVDAQYLDDTSMGHPITATIDGALVQRKINIYLMPTEDPNTFLLYCFYGGKNV